MGDGGADRGKAMRGRAAVLAAVVMQSVAQVAYGTWLTAVPSPLFVFGTFLMTAGFFLVVSGRGGTRGAWAPLLILNFGTALAFLSFFHALKLIEPAIVSAVNIGVGPILGIALALGATGARPGGVRVTVCLGILAGCAVLALSAAQAGGTTGGAVALEGLAAAAGTGVGTVIVTTASKALLDRGWKSGAVLAHRFYLILPVALLLALGGDSVDWTPALAATFLAVGIGGVLVPLYLLQTGIRLTDPVTVMVTMAAMPLVTFAVQGLSPAYAWSGMTAAGLVLITASIVVDMWTGRGRPAA